MVVTVANGDSITAEGYKDIIIDLQQPGNQTTSFTLKNV
jgi:hypothetical protein